MDFDLLNGRDLRMVNQAVFNENAVLLAAIFTLQEIVISIFRQTNEGFSPFVRYTNMFPVVF